MKKNNKIVYIVALVISAFLLWLWYWLGFDHVDAPLDLVLSIIWWLLVAGGAYAIHRVEKKRQERVRTCYVAGNHVFNSERGSVSLPDPADAPDVIFNILSELEYGMDIEDTPRDAEGDPVRYDYIVRSRVFDLDREGEGEDREGEKLEWEGEVAAASDPDGDPVPFEGREQLGLVLGRLRAASAAAGSY